MKASLVSMIMLLFAVQEANAALVFSVTPSSNFAEGGTSFDVEIRVTGDPGDGLQYFALQANVSTLLGGKTLNIASAGTLNTLNSVPVRTSADYLFNDRGLAVTGVGGLGKATFISNVTATSAEFRDGVAIPAINDSISGNPIPNTAVNPGGGAGRLVARLQYTLTAGTFSAGDSFLVSLSKLSSISSEFASSTLGTSPLSFTGAATNYNGTTGLDLNNSLVLNSQTFSITAVPEPSSMLLIGVAAIAIGARKVRRRQLANNSV